MVQKDSRRRPPPSSTTWPPGAYGLLQRLIAQPRTLYDPHICLITAALLLVTESWRYGSTLSSRMVSSWEKQLPDVELGSLPRSCGDHFSISCSHFSILSNNRLFTNTTVHSRSFTGHEVAYKHSIDYLFLCMFVYVFMCVICACVCQSVLICECVYICKGVFVFL